MVTVGGQQYALFTVNVTSGGVTTSTLYEVNVATGQPKVAGDPISATLSLGVGIAANSALSYDALTGTLWLGDTAGGIWSVNITGRPALDAATALKIGTTSPADPVNFVGYGERNSMPYVWAGTKNKVTTFVLTGTSTPAWASQGGASPQGYKNGSSVAYSVVRPLKSTGEVSAPPVLVNGVLVVPVFVPPAAGSCLAGTGYYQLFDMASGGDPKITVTYNGVAVTAGEIYLGGGSPLAPSLHGSKNGIVGYPGTDTPPATGDPSLGSINFGGKPLSRSVLWRQR